MASIYDPIPNSPFYYPQTNNFTTPQGYIVAGNGVSVDQFGALNVASALGGTVTSITAGDGLLGGIITVSGTLSLAPATNVSIGGIKVGANLIVSPDGTLSALPPGTGTVSRIIASTGLSGGGTGPNVTLQVLPATPSQLGGIVVGTGLTSGSGGLLSVTPASTTDPGVSQLATSTEVIAGTSTNKVITPATLSAKTATTLRPGLVQLSDDPYLIDSTLAATPTAVKAAYDAAILAQSTANVALPTYGGTMTGIITFAPGQTFPGVALPKATTNSLGVIAVGPGLNVNTSGVLSTANNGTVTSITAGPGLGAPASGNIISTSGTLRLLPPTSDGLNLGGVKAGDNVEIDFDGTINVPGSNFITTNNPYAFNGYQWPIPLATPSLPFPGTNGQVLTVLDRVSGQIGWTSTGTLTSVVAGTGITVVSTPTTATVSLTSVPSVTPGSYGATGLIPTLSVNEYGQITSTGLANPYPPFLNATVTAPPSLVLNFNTNNTNWKWTLQGNTTIQNPLNAESGMTGRLLLTQGSVTPYVITWGSAWKFANLTPYSGNPTAGTVDLIEFVVVDANYIVVTNIVTSLG